MGPTIQLTIDGVPLRDVAITGPVSLSSLVPTLPPISWLEVTASSSDKRFIELVRPAITYPRSEIRLSIERGKPAIGLYREVAPDLPAPVARIAAQPIAPLGNVVSVDIVTRAYAANGFAIEVAGNARQLDPASLSSSDKRGWPIADVLAAVAPDVHAKRLRASDEDSEQLIELLPGRDVTLKLTHQGGYVLRVWENGRAVVDVRPLTKLVVE